jgi:hypothetical protein
MWCDFSVIVSKEQARNNRIIGILPSASRNLDSCQRGYAISVGNFPYDGIDQTTFAVFTRAPVHLSFHSYLAPTPGQNLMYR